MFDRFYAHKEWQKIRRLITYIEEEDVEITTLERPQLPQVSIAKAFWHRRSERCYSTNKLSAQDISNVLWCADGINTERGYFPILRTAPTASNHQEIDIYVFDERGCYRYLPTTHSLSKMFEGDVREFLCEQDFVLAAPVIICLTADYSEMHGHNRMKRIRYSNMDVGYVSQNIYLYCAAAGLATVACGRINRYVLNKLLRIKNGDALLCHPIGYRI